MRDLMGAFESGSRIIFAVVALVLSLFAATMTVYAVAQAIYALIFWESFGLAILTGVGYMVIAIAVFEVAKYLVEEEVMRGREMRSPSEARRSMTKFISTISIAVFLEALVIVFQVAFQDVASLIYPAMLLLTGILLIVGLGVFQRLSAAVETEVGVSDARANDKQRRRAP